MITNNTKEKISVTYPWCYVDDIFTNEELEEMCKYFNKNELKRGETVGNLGENIINENKRKSYINFYHPDENNFWIFNRINDVITYINNTYYNFDLIGYNTFQYTEYHGDELGEYDFHIDMVLGSSNITSDMIYPRKLSITILLNDPEKDFEGGNFEINENGGMHATNVPTKKGRCIMFPSFLIHRVAPVTKGIRKSLVVWVEGPKFK